MGDVKLTLLLGAGLGWGVVGAISLAFLRIFPAAVGMLIRGGLGARRQPLPFAPFLALGTLVILSSRTSPALAGADHVACPSRT
jgi:prepilin signal peptidase PulO-like enzyme (type II secretory pathway)